MSPIQPKIPNPICSSNPPEHSIPPLPLAAAPFPLAAAVAQQSAAVYRTTRRPGLPPIPLPRARCISDQSSPRPLAAAVHQGRHRHTFPRAEHRELGDSVVHARVHGSPRRRAAQPPSPPLGTATRTAPRPPSPLPGRPARRSRTRREAVRHGSADVAGWRRRPWWLHAT